MKLQEILLGSSDQMYEVGEGVSKGVSLSCPFFLQNLLLYKISFPIKSGSEIRKSNARTYTIRFYLSDFTVFETARTEYQC